MTESRDRTIEILLRQRRNGEAISTPTARCLDPEVLAAWIEGGLTGSALADAEQHAADCARCQALLASMAQTMPEPDARGWWQVLSAKWLVPVAAAATALLVWVSVGRSPEPAPKPAPPVLATSDRAAPSAAAANDPGIQGQLEPEQSAYPRSLADAASSKQETADRRARAAGAAEQPATKIAAGSPQRTDALDKTADAISPQSGAERESAKPVAQPVAQAPSPGPPPPAPQHAATPAAVPVPSANEAVAIRSEAASTLTGRAGGAAGGRVGFANDAEIRSPQADYRWRIVPPSGIQRSVDGGVTWSVVDPVLARDAAEQRGSSQIVLTSGSSPSRDVCWIVGRSGVVLLTTDGATWLRRPIPEPVDLTGVRPVDARSATVTTADGRQFVTADGGVTWTLSREEPDVERH